MGKTRLKAAFLSLLITSISARAGWRLHADTHPVSITIDLIVLALMAWGIYFLMRAAYEDRR